MFYHLNNGYRITDKILENKNSYFLEMVRLLNDLTDRTETESAKLFKKVEKNTLEVISLVTNEWHELMKNEVTLHQQLLVNFVS